MAKTIKIKFLNFSMKENPELIKKLNAVAPYEYMPVHHLANKLLMKALDALISQYGITSDQIQSAMPD
jgi:hypothetical protein